MSLLLQSLHMFSGSGIAYRRATSRSEIEFFPICVTSCIIAQGLINWIMQGVVNEVQRKCKRTQQKVIRVK